MVRILVVNEDFEEMEEQKFEVRDIFDAVNLINSISDIQCEDEIKREKTGWLAVDFTRSIVTVQVKNLD